jgi:hypothetical protein
VFEHAQQALTGGVQDVDQASAARSYAANTSCKRGDKRKSSKTIEDTSSGSVSIGTSEIVKVQAFELLSAQAAHPREITQNRYIPAAE